MQNNPKVRDLTLGKDYGQQAKNSNEIFLRKLSMPEGLTNFCSIFVARFTGQHREEEEALSDQTPDGI